MHCAKCGAENDDSALMCVRCGASLNPAFGYAPAAAAKTSGKAVASLILGIMGIVACWAFTGIPALILGILGKRDIDRSGGRKSGRGLATAGIVTGICSFISPVALGLVISMIGAGSMRAKEILRATDCQENLVKIERAVNAWAIQHNKPKGSTVPLAELVGPDRYLKTMPRCRGGGRYPDILTVGVAPACSYVPPASFDTMGDKYKHAIPPGRR